MLLPSRLRTHLRLAPLALFSVVLGAACLQGARAPQVAPRGTLAPEGAEAGLAKPDGAFGVIFASPKGATVDPSEITLVFNRPMRPLDTGGQEAPPPVVIKPAAPGHWLWVGTHALSFSPEGGRLARATEFTVEVPVGTRALDGSLLEKPYVLRFSTARPELLAAEATEGSDAIKPSSTFRLRFNQPVDEAAAMPALALEAPVGGKPANVAFDLKRPDPKNEQLLELTPKEKLPLDATVKITAAATLRGREGPLVAATARSFSFHTYGPFSVKRANCDEQTPHGHCDAANGFALELTNGVLLADAKKAIHIEPAVAIRWPRWADDTQVVKEVAVLGHFVPGKTYRVRVAAGLKDQYGQPLAHEWTAPVVFDDLWPKAAIGLRGSVVEPSVRKGIPIGSVNAKEIELATAPLTEEGILKLEAGPGGIGHTLQPSDVGALAGGKLTTLHPSAPVNKPSQHLVDLASVLGGKDKRGPIAIAIGYEDAPGKRMEHKASRSVIAQVTDLGVSAKVSPHGSLVWVTHLSNASPVVGASVTIARPGEAATAVVKTDASGFATIPEAAFAPVKTGPEHAVIFVHMGDDWTYRRADDTLDTWRFGVASDFGPERPFGMIFTDRGIYRPGDVVRIKGILREPARAGSSTPSGRSVELTVHGADGDTIATTTTTLSAFGTMSVDVKVPEAGRLGTYSIHARVPGQAEGVVYADFEVAEYRPAEFSVGVESDKPSYVRGDKATWTARGDYLFGAPMGGAEARLAVTRSQAFFTPPGLDDGFVTGDESYWSGQSETSERQYEVQNAHAKLDAKGMTQLQAALPMPGQRGAEVVTAEADVTDLSRQTSSASTSAMVHPAEFYVALRAGADLFVKTGDPVKPEILAVDPKGGHVAQVPVTVELVKRSWSVAREEVGGGVRSVSSVQNQVVATCSVTTAVQPVSCTLTPPGPGYFIVHATAADKRKNPIGSSAGVYVTGDVGDVSWGDNDQMRVELVTDRSSYEVGQKARILVKSPFKTAEALVTVERSGLITQRRITLSGPMPSIEIPVTDDLRPNAFVSVLLVRGRSKAPPDKAGKTDIGAPAFRLGYAPIRVNPEARRLKIALKPSRESAGPGDTIDVDVEVKDRAGKPARSEVTLYAVDEGVLSLIGYKTPDPIPVFGAARELKVATLESRESLAQILNPFGELGFDKGLDGGGGAGRTDVRHDFRASAYFNPSLLTDDSGRAHVSFKLPDSLTTYRIMAVVTAEDDRFGYAESHVVTSRPLMARPAFPRFVRAGDTLDAGVVVTIKGLPKTKIDVSIVAEGITLKDVATKSIELDPNTSAEVRFALEAPRAGPAKVRFRVKGGGVEDAVEITREVKVPQVLEAVALYGDTIRASAEKIGDMAAIRDDVGGLEVSLSSTALIGLGDGAEQLLEYPYGCTEQLTSRLVPMLPLRDLANDYKVKLPKDTDKIIAKTVADIISHQRGDGGFGFWAESTSSHPWVTAYALWGLSVAKRHGVKVPDGVIDGATRNLREALSAKHMDLERYATGPFILDVLAENGAPDPGRVTVLFEAREKLPLFAQAQLLHAMVLSKSDGVSIDLLASELEGHLRLDADVARAVGNTGTRYASLMDSDTRTSALVLRGLLAAKPDHALGARLAMGLLEARKGGVWRSTQETAWSLLALDDYRKAQEKTAPDFTGRVFLGEAELFEAGFHGRSLDQPHTTIPATRLVAGSGAPLAFDVEGKGRLFYEARLRYAKKTLPTQPLDRGFYVKKTLRSVRPEGLEDALKIVPDASLSAFNGGDLVLADIVVVTPSPRNFVVIDDPLAAGFEAVDMRLATSGRGYDVDAAAARAGDGAEDEGEEADDPSSTAYRLTPFIRELRDDRVLFFVDHMPAGMFRYRYLARATTLGSFVVPPAKAEEMYTPEVFGRTASDLVRITAK